MDEKRKQEVAEIQKDFEYKKFELGDYKVYRCAKPGTNVYAFEIILGTMGIYVGGDIGTLTFRVARGLDFLAGNDVDYYIRSKLEHDYLSQNELCKKRLDKYLVELLRDNLDTFYNENKDILDPPENLDGLVKFYQEHDLDHTTYEILGEPKGHNKAWELYESLNDASDLQEVYNTIYNSRLYDGEMPSIAKTSESIMFRLYMVNHAAIQILKQESEDSATKTIHDKEQA